MSLRRLGSGVFEHAGLIALVHEVLVHAVRLGCRCVDRNALLFRVFEKVGAPFEAIEKATLFPGCNDFQLRRQSGERQFEPHLIVALAGSSM